MKTLQELGNRYENQSPSERRKQVGEMVNDASVAETHVLLQMKNMGWAAHKNPDAKGTDILLERSGSMLPTEIKFRSGLKPDCGGSPNFFFEMDTNVGTSYERESRTWQDRAPMYITVFSDGTMWCKKYRLMRQMIDDGLLKPYIHISPYHQTRGALVSYRELQDLNLLTIVSSTCPPAAA